MAQLLTTKQAAFVKEIHAEFEADQNMTVLDMFDVYAHAVGGDENLLGHEGLKELIFRQLKDYCCLDKTVVAVAKNVSDIKETTEAAITAIDNNDTSSLRGAYSQLKEYQERILELEMSVYTDEVTGVKNRKYLVNHELTEGNFKYSGTLMHMRVNNFAEINRDQGNEAGDTVLRFVSNVLQKYLKSVGIHVIRYIGVEFVAVSKAAVSTKVTKIFEETLNLILSKKFKTHEGQVINIELEFTSAKFEKGEEFQEAYERL
jgi:diguanylate cyclase (GGDEF)-like protein